ncbi:hypothetical protein C8R43DRAFT_944399 [Mycena crocata]|nr:hypothetical protein C8R43DRAFT_944399 [Mycena crocata]
MPSYPSPLFTPPPEGEDSDEEDQLVDDVENGEAYRAPSQSLDFSDSSLPTTVSYKGTESSSSLVHVGRSIDHLPSQSRMMPNGFLSNPIAQEFIDRVFLPRVDYHRLVLDRTARSICRRLNPHYFNLVDLGRVYGVNHNPIRKAVLNAYKPADNINEDPSYLPADILRSFPYIPPIPLKQPRVTKKTVAQASRRIAQLYPTERTTRARAKPPPPRESDHVDTSDGEEHHQGKRQRRAEGVRIGRAVKITKTTNMHSPAILAGKHPLPDSIVPPANAEQGFGAGTAGPSSSALPSELPHPTTSSGDAALKQFLSSVRRFNMTDWNELIVETGFKSMREVRTLASYCKDDLKETIDDLFKLPEGGMNKLERVSLMNAIADLERKK